MSLKLPTFEMYGGGSQIRRSAQSVPSNIVEGFSCRRYKQDYIKFLVYAHASCNETIEHLEILYESGSLTDKKLFEHFMENYDKFR